MIHKAIAGVVILQICLSQLTVGQLLTFKDGRVGVNFGGYHASAGLGGGANGGFLSAEAGTPHGQSAKAGLGGRTDQNGRLGGNLYAGATGGQGLTAAAGLGGQLEDSDTPRAIGSIYADAQSGKGKAEAGLHGKTVGGEKAVADGEIYSNARSPGGYAAEAGLQGRVGGGAPPSGVIRTKTVVPKEDGSVYIEKVKTAAPTGGVRNRFNDGDGNEGDEKPIVEGEFYRPFEAREPPRGVIRTETSVPDSDVNVYNIEKTKSVAPSGSRQRYNNDQNEVLNGGSPQYANDQQDNFYTYRKTVQIGGGGASPQDNLEPTITYLRPHHQHHHLKHRLRAPVRKTVILQSSPPSEPSYEVYGAGSSDVPTATRFDKNFRVGGGTFFDDIFNIPISSLRAVNGLLTNGVNRGFEFQKTLQSGNQGIEPQPAPAKEVSQSSSAGVTFGSRYGGGDGTFLGDILNIPISTLRAVNGFLSKNVAKGTVSVDKTVRNYK